jgi:hypothetical protein
MKAIARLIALATALNGLLFSGCASMDASNQESLLAAAGFVSRTPQTAKQHELYNAAPAYKIQRATVKGKVLYAYKDEKKGVAWIGDEAAYQRYQKLAVEQQIAHDQWAAAEMSYASAWGWYGAWGPYYPAYGPGPIRPIGPVGPIGPRPMPVRR